MKILHINSYYAAGKFYKNLYDIQIKNGLKIDVFVPIASNINIDNFDYGSYSMISRNHNKMDRIFFCVKQKKIYQDILSKYNINDYSLIHAHSLFSNGYIAYKLKKKFGIPYIVAIRNTDVNVFFKKLFYLRKIGNKILNEASQIIFLSKSYKDLVLNKYVQKKYVKSILSKISIIPNGIDRFWFDNIGMPKIKPINSNLKLLQIGDINRNKNIITTINAIKLLIKKGYKIKLDIVGKVLDYKIYKKIQNLYFVNFIGYKLKEDLLHIYRDNDIFILPSISETFGLVYAEAMSQGLPVIYTRGQGFDNQFSDGIIGFSVDCYDVNEIVNRIEFIINVYSELSKNAIDLVNKFQWNNIQKMYFLIYSNILLN